MYKVTNLSLLAILAAVVMFICYPTVSQADSNGVCPATQCVGGSCTVTQSLDTVTNDDNTVACAAAGVGTTQQGWARCYDLAAEGVPPGDFEINSVTFGVQQADIDGIQIDMVIYSDNDGCPPPAAVFPGNAVEIAREPVIVNTADVGTFITVPFPIFGGPTILSGNAMIVEFEQVQDGTVPPVFFFRPISNMNGQCGSSYLRAAPCGIIGWIPLVDIGFPDAHLIQIVEGTVCDPDPRTQGFWHRQCLGVPSNDGGIDPGRNGRGPQQPLLPDFAVGLRDCADSKLIDLGFFGTSTCDGMDANPPSDKCEQAQKQLTALILNVCSGQVQNSCSVDLSAEGCISTNVGELIDELATLIQGDDCNTANACAAAVNEGNVDNQNP